MQNSPLLTTSPNESWRKRFRRLHSDLTAAEQRTGEYFETHADSAYLSITEVVANSGIGYGTIVRFCQKLGYKGFQEFKLLLAADDAINAARSSSDSGLSEIDEVKTRLRRELNETLRLLDDSHVQEAAQLLSSSHTVLIVGVASSAPLVLSLAWKLSRIGIDARASTEGYVMATQATLLNDCDTLFAVSASGATKDILHTADVAASRNASIIALTNFSSSPLSQMSDICLFTTSSRDPLKAEIPSIIAGEAVAEILLDRLLTLAPERREHLLKSSKAVSDRKI
jgi:DNA-binding MurR/RpiR family transcriptional regulator